MRSALLLIVLAVGTLLVSVPAVRAEDEPFRRLKVSLGYHFSSGKYGTADTTEIGYVPLVTKAEWGHWSFEVAVPYIRVSGSPTFVNGPVGPVQTVGGEEDGLGDVTSRGSYTFFSRADWMPFIELIGRVKYPTASRAKGLGTGEFDYGFETELVWVIDRFVPFVSGGYRFLGSSADFQLDDVWLGSVGAMYRVLDPLWGGLSLDYREAATSTSSQRLELIPFVSWKVDQHWSVDPYASVGLSDGSPAYGVGLQIGYTL